MAASSDATNGVATKLYDAILTDFEMPVMNGPTSVKEMRLMGYKNKIFGVTGNGLAEQVHPKPFIMMKLNHPSANISHPHPFLILRFV